MPELGQVIRALGGLLEVRVEIDTGTAEEAGAQWGVAEWGIDSWGSTDPSWFDISAFVESVNIGYGAERWGERFNAGSASIVVDNTEGLFTPESGVPVPWVLPWRPGRRIRVVCLPDPTNDSVKEPLFTGYVDASMDTYNDAGFNISTTVQCVDNMGRLAAYNPPALEVPTGVQDTDARVEAALDRISWPAPDRDIQAGDHTMQSSHLAQSILEECARAAEAEGGAFYVSPAGIAVFRARDWLTTDTRSVNVQGWLGYDEIPDGENSAHVLEIRTSWEMARVINQVRMARTGGTVQEVNDAASQALNESIRTFERLDLYNNADAQVLALAERVLLIGKDSRVRVDAVKITGSADPDNEDLNRLLWDTQIGDLLSVNVEPPWGWGFERLVQVMGVSHRITADDWEVELRLDDALINFAAGREVFMNISEPVAWWRFDEPSGTATDDEATGSLHDLTWTGGPTQGGTGPIAGVDGAIALDGVNDWAAVANEAALELRQDMSIEVRFRPHDTAGADQAIISCRASSNPLYEIFYNPDTDRIIVYPFAGAGNGIVPNSAVAANVWHHIVFTIAWEPTGRRLRVFHNGVPIGGGSDTTYLPDAAARVINIGRRAIANDLFFDGDISELAIWDRVLTDGEVLDLYNSNYNI